MDIIFDCPKCSQELAVDGSGAGSEIECPACGETILIPATGKDAPAEEAAAPAVDPNIDPATLGLNAGHNPILTSAAAKVEMHLKVPVSAKPTASLIAKASKPLEVAAKETDKKIRVKTIRHTDCVEVGHDKFDEVVTSFLNKCGEKNVISITPLTYSTLDISTQKQISEYAVFIVYRG